MYKTNKSRENYQGSYSFLQNGCKFGRSKEKFICESKRGEKTSYSQTGWTLATRLSFWHVFDKFLISLMASGCTTVHTNDLWNVQFQPVLQTQKTIPVRKVKFDQIFVGIKFIYRQLNLAWSLVRNVIWNPFKLWRLKTNHATVDTPPPIFQGIWLVV